MKKYSQTHTKICEHPCLWAYPPVNRRSPLCSLPTVLESIRCIIYQLSFSVPLLTPTSDDVQVIGQWSNVAIPMTCLRPY